MIREIIEQWEENKHCLQNYFANTPQDQYGSYTSILKKIFELVITKAPSYGGWNNSWDVTNMTVLDHGDYQGTLIYIIPVDTYQPSVSDYIMTNNYYGSCTGCDSLQMINDGGWDDKLPNKQQIQDYMTLSLHLVQKMKMLEDSP